LLVLVTLAACRREEPVPTSRYEAVKSAKSAPAERWCDVEFDATKAPTLAALPGVPAREGATPALPPGNWVWLNLWATWCKPCLREMPLLASWRDQLRRDGVPLDVWFLSVDEEEAELTQFLRANPKVAPAPSLRANSPAALQTWLKRTLPDPSAPIPIHMLIAPGGTIRCIRTGSLQESDYASVRERLR
jgi:thiol-disulfide isomerase/thioredoxin